MNKIVYWVITLTVITLVLSLIFGCASRNNSDDYWGSVAVGVGNQVNKDKQ